MSDTFRITEQLIGPAGGTLPASRPAAASRQAEGDSFADVLQRAQSQQSGAVRFSTHAQTRLQSRQIPMGESEMKRIEGAVQQAANKGARESLILVDQAAYVVSITNRTVITVVDRNNLKNNVFTNIDSAVIA